MLYHESMISATAGVPTGPIKSAGAIKKPTLLILPLAILPIL
jgi:hypothetical protein